ncbi:MAG: hypothetical protein M0R20_01445 [Candidatus Omnitrophica bacterium]|jgi:hypothetical protein|nr:hypothetical protein [Candidatus Omnitrophota bacterium]
MKRIRIVITLVLFLLFLIANVYAVRVIALYGAELYLYDKLLVAYRFAGNNGLKEELNSVLSRDKMRHELVAARGFESNLKDIDNPGKFLENIVNDRKNKINFFRNLRNITFGFIVIMFLLRVAVNRCSKPEK